MRGRIDPIDSHVGRRLRMRRLIIGLSQAQLAKNMGLTFQQIQKYEKGSNRISASRLQQISSIIDVPISFFFEDAPAFDVDGSTYKGEASTNSVMSFLTTSEGIQLAQAYLRIKNAAVRRSIVDMVQALADDSDPQPGSR